MCACAHVHARFCYLHDFASYSVYCVSLLSSATPYCFKFEVKVKFPRYRPGVVQRVGRGIALLFHYRGTRRGWVVSSTPRPHFTAGKDPVPIVQEAGWAPGPVWKGGKSRPHGDSIPDRPARSQSLYRLSYPAYSFKFKTPCNLRCAPLLKRNLPENNFGL